MVRLTLLNKEMADVPVPPPVEDALELTFDDIANVPVADANSVSDWNTFFDLPTYGTPFTSVDVVGNMVKLIPGGDIIITEFLMVPNSYLVSIDDKAGCVIWVTPGISYSEKLTSAIFPNAAIVLELSFKECPLLNNVSIPICTDLGGRVLDDGVFTNISGNAITLTIPAALMTCNGGNPDGDIQYLQANNTVTVITV